MTTTAGNFGPLTTVFPPPSDCTSQTWVAHNANATMLRWGPTCATGSVGYATSCYPSGWSGSKANDSSNTYKAFYPGWYCPSGWTGAFSASDIQKTSSFLLSEFVTSLAAHDAVTVCCPSGYGFNGGDSCTSNTATIGTSLPLVTTAQSECTTKTVPPYVGVIGTSTAKTPEATFQAMPVILIRDTRTPVPSSTGDSSAANNSTGGLSTGAKIAIGVCIPVGVLLMAAIWFIWWHRRRRARAATQAEANSSPSAPTTAASPGDPYFGKPELDASAASHPRPSLYEKQELDAGNEIRPGVSAAPAELPALQALTTPQAELPAQKSPDTPQAGLMGDLGERVSTQNKADSDGTARAL
ncbi:uncharacterized protein N7459_009616 [Penicillium hispanicum]|uniref:uncharacterized protein n=1 Tax=Penicillium hispanicum TaxID=1080232 RepID=UPI00253FE403|nr:uncharacterized protein N7459_009616 [Penicillium hispanicum]KAJ5570186.1 hypothetical protein N7459_009616 [Penicillium hispanicum]